MTVRFPCPYLDGDVELTDEREQHIASRHPDLYGKYWRTVSQTLADPDLIRVSQRDPNTRLFTRWFDGVEGGKFVVVASVSDAGAQPVRYWLSTAYIARRLGQGETVEWQRS